MTFVEKKMKNYKTISKVATNKGGHLATYFCRVETQYHVEASEPRAIDCIHVYCGL